MLIAYPLKTKSRGHSTNNQSHRNWHHSVSACSCYKLEIRLCWETGQRHLFLLWGRSTNRVECRESVWLRTHQPALFELLLNSVFLLHPHFMTFDQPWNLQGYSVQSLSPNFWFLNAGSPHSTAQSLLVILHSKRMMHRHGWRSARELTWRQWHTKSTNKYLNERKKSSAG